MNHPTVLDHLVDVVQGEDFTSGLRVYRAECSCGWASDWTDDQADAHDATTDHQEVVW